MFGHDAFRDYSAIISLIHQVDVLLSKVGLFESAIISDIQTILLLKCLVKFLLLGRYVFGVIID